MSAAIDILRKQQTSNAIHIALQVSPFFDMLNGSYYKSDDGLHYLNGGMQDNSFIAGGSNTQKTGLLVFFLTRFFKRHPKGIVIYNDSESTLDINRLRRAIDDEFYEGYFDNVIMNPDNPRFLYFAGKDGFDGTALHNLVKEYAAGFNLDKKDDKHLENGYVTKFLDKNGKRIVIPHQVMLINDSLTDMRFNEASIKFMEGDVDEGGKKRTRDMEYGNLKRVVFEDVTALGTASGMRIWWVGQITDVMNLDGKPQEKQSTYIRVGKKISKCPRAVLNLPSTGYDIIKGSALKNDQEWMYPNPNGKDTYVSPDAKENPDLMEYTFSLYRNKGGTSGQRLSFIGSQSEGILEGLSMYHLIKTSGYYGLQVGSKVSHACDLYPEFKVGRTTIREKIKTEKRFYRAVSFCFQMWFMQTFWLQLDAKFYINPTELYEQVKARGYDWNKILDTIDYDHDNPDITERTFTTRDLMLLGLGELDVEWLK